MGDQRDLAVGQVPALGDEGVAGPDRLAELGPEGPEARRIAAGGVPEYWVVDLAAATVHVLRSPGPQGYAEHLVATRGERISPAAFPDATLSVDSLFVTRS